MLLEREKTEWERVCEVDGVSEMDGLPERGDQLDITELTELMGVCGRVSGSPLLPPAAVSWSSSSSSMGCRSSPCG